MEAFKYQLAPIDYFVNKCKSQHGLVLNHALASGKTLTSLYFLKNYPKSKKIVVLPAGLQSVWVRESRRLDVKGIKYITFKDLSTFYEKTDYYTKLFKDSVVVIDESHNLYNIIDEFRTMDTEVVEILADKNVLDKYALNDYNKYNFLATFIDILNSTKKILLVTGTIITRKLDDIRWLVNIAAGKDILPYNEKRFSDKYIKKNKLDILTHQWLSPIYKTLLLQRPQEAEKQMTSIEFLFKFVTTNFIIETTNFYRSSFSKKFSLKDLSQRLIFVLIIMSSFNMIHNFITTYYRERKSFGGVLDADAFKKAKIGRYFSYYRPLKHDPLYPKINVIVKNVDYTKPQLELWTKFVNMEYIPLTPKELVDLELHKNLRDAELYAKTKIDLTLYQNKGRIIGNLYEEPEKFKKIVEAFKTKKQRTVVYSEFYESGALAFIKYLKKRGIKYAFYTPDLGPEKANTMLDDFKDGKIKMLVLHPKSSEGVNIKGARVFHLLEPIPSYFKQQQLFARVSRLNSHTHLDKSKRNVSIYTWRCTLTSVFSALKTNKQLIKTFFQNNKWYENFFVKQSKMAKFVTPDDQILTLTQNQARFIESVNDIISKNNIEKYM